MAIDFEAIRRENPLAAVVARSVKLKKAGNNMSGCCPFHADRTPSFVVYGSEHYHCFGCQAHGDVIDFVAEMDKVSTAEAVRRLTGGELPTLTEEDRARRRREREEIEARQRREQENAIQEARLRWERALPVNGTGAPYLSRKNVAPYGCRREGDGLLVPIHDAAGVIQSVQLIPGEPGGKKLFHAGAPVAGGRYALVWKDAGPIVIGEGFATCATVQEATGATVVVAFSKRNIETVARDLRHRFPARPIIIAADMDAEEFAHGVAEGVGGRVVMPELAGAEGSDFNDQAAHYGTDDVARSFAAALDKGTETPLPLVWLSDVQPLLNGNWIVKNVIPAQAMVTVIGHPGCGKSFLALDVALHIAKGEAWRERKVKPGLVIYLAAEGQRGQMNRVEAWKRHYGCTDLPFALIPVAINLRDSEADLPKLIQTIEAACDRSGLPLSVLIVDTLNRTFGGGDENTEDMSQYVDNTGKLRAHFQATTVVVHHVPKNGDALLERGHGSLRGAIDTSLAVLFDEETKIRTLRCTKQKDAEDGWELQFKLKQIELGEDEDGDMVTSCVVVEADEEAPSKHRGPHLSATQRQVYNELLACLAAAPVSVPTDIPDDVVNRHRVGKVVARRVWRDRWMAIGGADKAEEVASSTFRRAVTDLQNKGLVGVWNDHAWATHV